MLVGIPVHSENELDSEIAPRLKDAKYFLILTIDNENITRVDVIPVHFDAFGSFPQFLDELGVRAVVCDSIGDKAREMFELQGISLFPGHSGKVSSVLSDVLPHLSELERRIKEEEERREKARASMERARRENVVFWVSCDGLVLVKLDDGQWFGIALPRGGKGGRLFLASPREQDKCEANGSILFHHFYGSRLTKSEESGFELGDGFMCLNGSYYLISWDDSFPNNQKMHEYVLKLCNEEGTNDKDLVKALNDEIRHLVEQYQHVFTSDV